MVQVAADAAHVRDGTSGLIQPEIDESNLNSIRRDILRALPDERIAELRALVKLGAFSNLDRMLRWISAYTRKTS